LLQFYYKTGPYTIPLGALGAFAGFFYSARPIQWSYRGVGEIWIGLCYGWLTVAASYYIQTGELSPLVHWTALPISFTLTLNVAKVFFHGCTAGRGFVYIKANGEVWPCPFVGVSAGNLRERPFSEIWCNSKVFQNLRQREKTLKGKCGECRFVDICGGCRSRAWALQNDYLSEDPSCFI